MGPAAAAAANMGTAAAAAANMGTAAAAAAPLQVSWPRCWTCWQPVQQQRRSAATWWQVGVCVWGGGKHRVIDERGWCYQGHTAVNVLHGVWGGGWTSREAVGGVCKGP